MHTLHSLINDFEMESVKLELHGIVEMRIELNRKATETRKEIEVAQYNLKRITTLYDKVTLRQAYLGNRILRFGTRS